MHWGFWIELRGPTRLWVVSITFLVVGALIAFALPSIVRPAEQAREVGLTLRVLGGIFILLGGAVLLPMIATLFISTERRETWHWWINFIGGLLGALAFAVPATLMFPVFLLAYLTRPNMLAPNDAAAGSNLAIGALFSVIGLIVLVALFFLTRKMVQDRNNPVTSAWPKEL